MAEPPEINPHDELRIGSRKAVACTVYGLGRIEVVYLDDRDRAINEDVVWRDYKWRFEHSAPVGGYADKHDRLQAFVTQLRHSHHYPLKT